MTFTRRRPRWPKASRTLFKGHCCIGPHGWQTCSFDLLSCTNASVNPVLAIFLAKMPDDFNTLDTVSPNESTLWFDVVGVLALFVPFVLGD